MRRRIRTLRRRRDALLLELGALVMEMHRAGRPGSELVKRRADEVSSVDAEARELARALGSGERLDDVVAAGILGACARCGTLLSTDTNFCSNCGTPVSEAAAPDGAGTPAPSGNTEAGSNGAAHGESAAVARER